MVRRGMTIVEVLMVVAVIGLLVALLIPAVQMARESARRAQCTDNMRQLGIGFASVESQQGAFPAGVTYQVKGPLLGDVELRLHNFMVDLLPYLEANSIYSVYHQDKMFCDALNREAIATPMPIALCPSTPDRDTTPTFNFMPSLYVSASIRNQAPFSAVWARLDKKYGAKYTGAVSDYAVPMDASLKLSRNLGYDLPDDNVIGVQGMFPRSWGDIKALTSSAMSVLMSDKAVEWGKRTKAAEITDGLSNTLMLFEDAGKPQRWQNGAWTGIGEPVNGAWADPAQSVEIEGVWNSSSPCLMQCDNNGELYSFHPAGVNLLFADGHVATAAKETEGRIVLAWLTPNKSDAAP